MERSAPSISVIIPLTDERGLAIESIRSWSQEQTYDRQEIELVLVADHVDPINDATAKAALCPQDVFVYAHTLNVYELFDIGARAAHGDFVLFTEHHVVADPGCVAALLTFFATQPYEAAACRNVGISENFVARMQERMFWEIFNGPLKQDFWKAVLARGFAIKRSLYLAEGGFKYQFEFFAEFALAIDLHKHQHPLGYASEAVVNHYNTHSLIELSPIQQAYARGELAYRAERPIEECAPYLGYIPTWSGREAYRKQNDRTLVGVIARNLLSHSRQYRKHTLFVQSIELLRYSWNALWGALWPRLMWRATLPLAWLKVHLLRFDEEKCYRAFQAYWRHIVQCGYWDYIVKHLAKSASQGMETYRHELYDVEDEQVVGFHVPECWQGENFRWSSAASMVLVSLPPSNYQVAVQLISTERALDSDVSIYFNEYKIAEVAFDSDSSVFTFRIDSSKFQQRNRPQSLVILSDARQVAPPERRQLSLPMRSIEFVPTL